MISAIFNMLSFLRHKLLLPVLAYWALSLALRYYRRLYKFSPHQCGPVFITGCDSGFGRLITLSLVRKGWTVLAGCLDEQSIKQIEIELSGSSGRFIGFPLDVTNQDQIESAMEIVKQNCPQGLWALINNAGIAMTGLVHWSTIEEYRRVMDINFFAAAQLTTLCSELLIKSKGRVINITSTFGRYAPPGVSHYAASKYALEGFSDSLRREMCKWGVKVIVIEPGFMRTQMLSSPSGYIDKKWAALPQHVRDMYGTDFYERSKEALTKVPLGDPNKVVKAVCEALVQRYPCTRVLVGMDACFVFGPLSLLPAEAADLISAFLFPSPVPQLAIKH